MIIDKKCKVCRRAGEKLFLKGEKCFTVKCVFNKKPYPPGKLDSERKHKSTLTEYGRQLREKQKVRNIYGVSEKQFSNYVVKATATKAGSPAERLYQSLENRLDNTTFRLGLAKSRTMARQMVSHGHITVNGVRSMIASRAIKIGDVIGVREGSKTTAPIIEAAKRMEDHKIPGWISFDAKTGRAEIKNLPPEKEKDMAVNLNSVIEFYSR
jgi:small subunit ribosomal protein S4